jgi:FkbM family methyltransferase
MPETKIVALGRHGDSQPVIAVDGFRLAGKDIQIRLDLSRATQRYIHDTLITFGDYEIGTMEEIATLKPGEVFFDVGAHCGFFSAIASAFCGAENVYAFEPNPENFRYLKAQCPKANLIEAAVGGSDDFVDFYWNFDNDGGHAAWNPAAHDWNEHTRSIGAGPVAVAQCCLNDFADKRPAIIKIDTEGSECRVLGGAGEVLAQPQLRVVICELNHFGLEQLGADEETMRGFMKHHGFTAGEETGDGVSNLIFRR